MEAIPRYDGKEKMNRYGNMMLHQAKMESTSIHKDKVTIGSHNQPSLTADRPSQRIPTRTRYWT